MKKIPESRVNTSVIVYQVQQRACNYTRSTAHHRFINEHFIFDELLREPDFFIQTHNVFFLLRQGIDG